jgi:hypothetical protein
LRRSQSFAAFHVSHGPSAWPERWLFPLGAIVGITAYAMSVYSIGVLKRRWLIRAIAVLLGIATTQPVMGIFFATSRITHLGVPPVLRDCILDRLSVNWITIESWLRFRNQPARA